MKKFILLFCLLISSFSFSNSAFDTLSKNVWRCTSTINPLSGLIYVHFLNNTTENKSSIMFTQIDTHNMIDTGKLVTEISKLDFEEKDNSFSFLNFNDKTKKFENYKLSYSFDKKNRAKLQLYRISDNKKICTFTKN